MGVEVVGRASGTVWSVLTVGLNMTAAARTLAHQALPTSGNTFTDAKEAAFHVSRALGRELKIDKSLKMAGNGGRGQAEAGGAVCTPM